MRTAYSLLVALLLTFGCEGPVGPQGPSGPQGSTGAQGPQGPAGNDGQDGVTGPQGPEGPEGPVGPQGPEGPSGQDGQDGQDGADGEPLDWADVLTEHRVEEAVYVLGFSYTHPTDGQRYFRMFCTGFAAYYTGAVWTNAHCVDEALEIQEDWARPDLDTRFHAVQAGASLNSDQIYEILLDEYWKHPDYEDSTRSEDIGLLDVRGELPVLLNLLPRRFADALTVGQPIGTLGFPGENSATGGDADLRATPTFKDGVVSALRLIDSGETPHVAVQYNFDTSGGTSGSAVFDHDGWVVAVNNSSQKDEFLTADGDTLWVGLGSLNFGIRVDAVWDFLDVLESGSQAPAFLDEPIRQKAYPHETYQPVPANWNGETLVP